MILLLRVLTCLVGVLFLPAVKSETGVVAEDADFQGGERLGVAADHVPIEVKEGAAVIRSLLNTLRVNYC